MSFRVLGILAVGIVCGFLLGGVAPRRELASTTKEVEALRRKLARVNRPNPLRELLPALAERGGGEGGLGEPAQASQARGADRASADGQDSGGITRTGDEGAVIIGAKGPDGRPLAAGGTMPSGAESAAAAAPSANASTATDTPRGANGSSRGGDFRGLDLQRFDELAAIQAARIAASRSALVEQAGLDEEEVAAVDDTVKQMNDELSGYGEEILQQASTEEPPSPSQALGLGHDVSGILFEGQKKLDGIVGEKGESVDPSAVQIWNYVDLERLRPAAEKLLPTRSGSGEPGAPGASAPSAGGSPSPGTATPSTGGAPSTQAKDQRRGASQ